MVEVDCTDGVDSSGGGCGVNVGTRLGAAEMEDIATTAGHLEIS